MKKLLLVAAIGFAFVACNNSEEPTEPTGDSTTVSVDSPAVMTPVDSPMVDTPSVDTPSAE